MTTYTGEVLPTDGHDYVAIQLELGLALRSALSSVLWEPLPDAIRLLLEQLQAKECQRQR
jgi:hypothetical protein